MARCRDGTRPDMQHRVVQAQLAAEILQHAGYVRIGLDHFAKPPDGLAQAARNGTLRRNFQGYTHDPADALIGFGASSIGQLPQGSVQNDTATAHYMRAIKSDGLATAKGFALSDDDKVRAAIIEKIMCDLALSWPAIEEEWKVPRARFQPHPGLLDQFARDGLIELAADGFTVLEDGRPFVRSIAAAFDAYLADSATRHSIAV